MKMQPKHCVVILCTETNSKYFAVAEYSVSIVRKLFKFEIDRVIPLNQIYILNLLEQSAATHINNARYLEPI